MSSRHTLSVLVENKPGVLARVAGLFSRRGYIIDSLAVGPTEHPEISRMTIVVNVDESPLEAPSDLADGMDPALLPTEGPPLDPEPAPEPPPTEPENAF